MSLANLPFSTITHLTLLIAYTLAVLVSPTVEFRATVMHVDRGKNLSKIELLRLALGRDRKRLDWLQATASISTEKIESTIIACPDYLYSEYLVELSIGTPPQPFRALMSTGSDLTWIQCTSCKKKCPQKSANFFNPKKSNSYKVLECPSKGQRHDKCTYNVVYADDSWSIGQLATETFQFEEDSDPVPKLVFGCSLNNSGDLFSGSGVLALGPTSHSFVSQLGVTEFSYCMPPPGLNEEGVLEMGPKAGACARADIRTPTTRLIVNMSDPAQPFYWIPFEGVAVGGADLVRVDGSGPSIISTGTTLTLLERGAFEDVKRQFAQKINLKLANGSKIDPGLELCFDVRGLRKIKVPTVVLKFEGAKVKLPKESYFVVDSGVGCLAMGAAEEGGPTILGNFQQQNMLVAYDIANGTISFVPNTQCDDM
ncbi:Eukaryotic aspartyl protease family protein [Striga hermonthica]|uniref:Eukaryotic aspartyl protease family protein n=1 Tax=Striga hermonthica TaxID=68872 RepID=A0A9N7RB92_STRHE|nr:Eukaryotic aspartyl protease family protein [Striga hermonthica]